MRVANDDWYHIIADDQHLLDEWRDDDQARLDFWKHTVTNGGPVRNIPFKSILER